MQNFLALQSQLEGTENRISVARRDYIEAVRAYNTELRTFPGIIWASTVFRDNKPMQTFTRPKAPTGRRRSSSDRTDAAKGRRASASRRCSRSSAPPRRRQATFRIVRPHRRRGRHDRWSHARHRRTQACRIRSEDGRGDRGRDGAVARAATSTAIRWRWRGNWRLGQPGKFNGAILLIAPNAGKVAIQASQGLRDRLTDEVMNRIIEQTLIPRLAMDDIAGGVTAGIDDMLWALSGPPALAPAIRRRAR